MSGGTNAVQSPPSSAQEEHVACNGCTERTSLLETPSRVGCTSKSGVIEPRVYRVRWLVLLVFWLHMLVNNWIWISFGSIADLVACYYDVSLFWINTLSWVFMLVYLLGFVPTLWFLNRYGLKATGVAAACANAFGACLRLAGAGWSYFPFLLAGHTVASLGNLLEWGAGSYLAGIWFPPRERAFATAAISSQGEQFGVLLGLSLSPLFIRSSNTEIVCGLESPDAQAYSDWQETIYPQLLYYLLAQAIFACILLVPTLFMPSAPPCPPSLSRQLRMPENVPLFKSSLRLLKNCYFCLYMIVFGIFVAGAGSFVTVFDEIIYTEYDSRDQGDVVYLGIAMQFCSVMGVLIVSIWIGYTKLFYWSALMVCTAATIAAALFAVCIQWHLNFYVTCIPIILTRALLVTFQGVGFEYGAEIAYPLPESFSSCILNGVSQFFSIVLIIVPTLMLQNNLTTYDGWFFAAVFLCGAIVMFFVRPKLMRVKIDTGTTKCTTHWITS